MTAVSSAIVDWRIFWKEFWKFHLNYAEELESKQYTWWPR